MRSESSQLSGTRGLLWCSCAECERERRPCDQQGSTLLVTPASLLWTEAGFGGGRIGACLFSCLVFMDGGVKSQGPTLVCWPLVCYPLVWWPLVCWPLVCWPLVCWPLICWPLVCWTLVCWTLVCWPHHQMFPLLSPAPDVPAVVLTTRGRLHKAPWRAGSTAELGQKTLLPKVARQQTPSQRTSLRNNTTLDVTVVLSLNQKERSRPFYSIVFIQYNIVSWTC